MPMNKSKLV